jgi:phage/plasmid primase-like uncharacterized protein
MKQRRDFSQLAAAASGRWPEIIRALGRVDLSHAMDRIGKHVRCPLHDGKTNANFRLFPDFVQTGGGFCNTCGPFGNGFALLSWLNGWGDVRVACREVAGYLDGDTSRPDGPPIVAVERKKPEWNLSAKALKQLTDVWSDSVPLPGTLGETYLRSRGISCDLPDASEVRFHPALNYWDDDQKRSLGSFPALVSLLRAPRSGAPLTIHRTYLSEDGTKAEVPRPKKLMTAAIDGAITQLGGAIELFPADGKTLAVTEGIETALAVRSAVPDRPVWACYSASVLTNFRPPESVDRVIVWGDLDEGGAGQLAAAKLVLRLRKQGVRATLLLPGRGDVFLGADAKTGWYSSDASREEIVQVIEGEGYRVVTEPTPSIDWLDVWQMSRLMVANAFRNLLFQGW